MSVPFKYREAACLKFIESGFKIETTIGWMQSQYGEEDSMKRAKYPEKLCRNILTLGGGGNEQQLNIVAFKNALGEYQRQLQERHEASASVKISNLESQLQEAESDKDVLQLRLADAQQQISEKERALLQKTEEAFGLRLQLQTGIVEPVAAEVG